MKYLAILLVTSLLLVPHSAAAPVKPASPVPVQADCHSCFLWIWASNHFTHWEIKSQGMHGQWVIYRSQTLGSGTYLGCPLYADPTNVYGPFVGDFDVEFDATYAEMAGYWQAITNGVGEYPPQTSNISEYFP